MSSGRKASAVTQMTVKKRNYKTGEGAGWKIDKSLVVREISRKRTKKKRGERVT